MWVILMQSVISVTHVLLVFISVTSAVMEKIANSYGCLWVIEPLPGSTQGVDVYAIKWSHGRPQAWARGGGLPPWNVEKCFLLQMLSKTSVDEVVMHHFEKMSSASGALLPNRYRGTAPGLSWGTCILQTPHCPPLEKILRGRPWMKHSWFYLRVDIIFHCLPITLCMTECGAVVGALRRDGFQDVGVWHLWLWSLLEARPDWSSACTSQLGRPWPRRGGMERPRQPWVRWQGSALVSHSDLVFIGISAGRSWRP